MKYRKSFHRIREYFYITVATISYSAGISLFLNPNDLAPGGITGISIIINRLTGLNIGSLIFILNIPILLLGIWKLGVKIMLSTAYALVWISVITNLFEKAGVLTNDRFLAALAGSVLVAASMGIIFKCHATTGGTDIVVKLLKLRFPHLKTGVLFMILDSIIVLTAGIVFRNIESALYAAFALVVQMTTMDVVLYGRDGAKMIYIISDNPFAIADKIMNQIGVGVTYLNGKGAFSNREKDNHFMRSQKKTITEVEEIVRKEDPTAFFIVTSANEIIGEGYKSYFEEKL